MGDKVTPEAYQNIARRLVHRGVLVANEDVRPIRYKAGQTIDGHWLEEEELAAWVSDEYPLSGASHLERIPATATRHS